MPEVKTAQVTKRLRGGKRLPKRPNVRTPSQPKQPTKPQRPTMRAMNYRQPDGQRTVKVGSLRWLNIAQQYSQKTGVPPEYFLALIQAESGGNNQAVGDGGSSVGLFQLHSRGVGYGLSVEERFDPVVQFEKMAPRIKAAYESGIAKGLQGEALAIHVGKEAERPAAGRETKYGFTYLQVTDALKNNGLSYNVGDFSQSGLLYGPGAAPRQPSGGRGQPTIRPATSPIAYTPQPAQVTSQASASPVANTPAIPSAWPSGNILGTSTPQTPDDYSDDKDKVTLISTPLGPITTERGQARRAVTTGLTFFGGLILIILGILWLILSQAKGGVGGVIGRGARVVADLAKGGNG